MSVSRPNPRVSKTILFIGIAVIANSFGNLMLALGMDGIPASSMWRWRIICGTADESVPDSGGGAVGGVRAGADLAV